MTEYKTKLMLKVSDSKWSTFQLILKTKYPQITNLNDGMNMIIDKFIKDNE